MAARVGDLVDDAQAQAWALIQPLPEDRTARGAAAEAEARAQIAAWPALAKAALLAMRAVPLADQDQGGRLAVLAALTGIARREHPTPAIETEHPRLHRMTHVLGAAADLLNRDSEQIDSDRPHDAVALFDRLSAAVETAATSTIAYCDVAHGYAATPEPPDALTYLAGTLRARRTTGPAERSSSLDDVSLAGPSDTSLHAAVQAWQQQARATLTPTEAARSTDAVARLARDLALLSRTTATTLQAGAAAGVIDSGAASAAARELGEAVKAWASVDRAWQLGLPTVSGAGPSPAQDTAHRTLHTAVATTFRAQGTWLTVDELAQRPDIHRMAQDARRTAGALAQLGRRYADTAATLVRSEVLLVPARGLARELTSTPPSLLPAISHGRWVPLPASAPTAQHLTTTITDASRASERAATLADVAVRPPHLSSQPAPAREQTHTAASPARRNDSCRRDPSGYER